MREVVARHRRGEPVLTADLLRLAADFTSPEFADRVRAIVLDGKDVEIDPETFAAVARLTTKRIAGSGGGAPLNVPAFELQKDVSADDALGSL